MYDSDPKCHPPQISPIFDPFFLIDVVVVFNGYSTRTKARGRDMISTHLSVMMMKNSYRLFLSISGLNRSIRCGHSYHRQIRQRRDRVWRAIFFFSPIASSGCLKTAGFRGMFRQIYNLVMYCVSLKSPHGMNVERILERLADTEAHEIDCVFVPAFYWGGGGASDKGFDGASK